MALCTTEAIVLKARNFSESSKVVTIYTEKYGKCAVAAKGARRPKSTLRGRLESITHTSIVFYKKEGREVHTLSQSDVITPFHTLQSDLERFTYASALCELLDRLTPAEAENRALFAVTLETLKEMEKVNMEKLIILFWFFELRMLTLLGFKPELDTCVHCKGGTQGNPLGFSVIRGGVLCSICSMRDEEAYGLSQESLNILRFMQRVRPENVATCKPSRDAVPEIDTVLHAFLTYHSDDYRDIKSLKVLNKLQSHLSLTEKMRVLH